jgi:hypothetical protein
MARSGWLNERCADLGLWIAGGRGVVDLNEASIVRCDDALVFLRNRVAKPVYPVKILASSGN